MSGPPAVDVAADVDAAARTATPHVIAALVRRGADLDAAEDALQDALLAAARQWPLDGVPAEPTAWLVTVAHRRLIDTWRAERSRTDREHRAARLDVKSDHTRPDPAVTDAAPEVDDSLALLLLCCHPDLPHPARVALTLRAVAGLSTAQIARAFLVPEPTMAQRLSRARARLRTSGARFTLAPGELPDRLEAVLTVLYLVFSEGHTSTSGAALVDVSLTDEALRLARHVHRCLPDHGEASGLLALMLLTDARRSARTDASGALVPLAEQDRGRWDHAAITEGVALLERTLPHGRVGPFQLQAAIAAVHADAPDAAATDWAQIVVLYGMLARLDPGPVVRLNHAVAIGEHHGPDAGLAHLQPLVEDVAFARHHRLHAVRAHLLERAGRPAEALVAYRRAAQLATSTPEQRHLLAAVARLAGTPPAD